MIYLFLGFLSVVCLWLSYELGKKEKEIEKRITQIEEEEYADSIIRSASDEFDSLQNKDM